MSSMQFNTGELMRLAYDRTYEEQLKYLLEKAGFTPKTWEGSYENQFKAELYDKYISFGGNIYALATKELDADGHSSAWRSPEGTIKFSVLFYNGGAGLGEVIEQAVTTLLRSEK